MKGKTAVGSDGKNKAFGDVLRRVRAEDAAAATDKEFVVYVHRVITNNPIESMSKGFST